MKSSIETAKKAEAMRMRAQPASEEPERAGQSERKKPYVASTFSLSMISPPATLQVRETNVEEAKQMLADGFTSVVGHQATAEVMSEVLGVQVPLNRIAVSLKPSDVVLVFQVLGRLPEGKVLSKEEMKAIPFKLLLVEVE